MLHICLTRIRTSTKGILCRILKLSHDISHTLPEPLYAFFLNIGAEYIVYRISFIWRIVVLKSAPRPEQFLVKKILARATVSSKYHCTPDTLSISAARSLYKPFKFALRSFLFFNSISLLYSILEQVFIYKVSFFSKHNL